MELNNQFREQYPPIILFGAFEKNTAEQQCQSENGYYDYITQKTIMPLFCGSDKKVTKSAKNVGGILFPKWKNETDDAKEK